MEEILKENKSKSNKDFEKLLNEDLSTRKFSEGDIVTGTVEEVGRKYVLVDVGLKSSAAIPLEEFTFAKEEVSVNSKCELLHGKLFH